MTNNLTNILLTWIIGYRTSAKELAYIHITCDYGNINLAHPMTPLACPAVPTCVMAMSEEDDGGPPSDSTRGESGAP